MKSMTWNKKTGFLNKGSYTTVQLTRTPCLIHYKIYPYIPRYPYTVMIMRPGPRPLLCTDKVAQCVPITRPEECTDNETLVCIGQFFLGIKKILVGIMPK